MNCNKKEENISFKQYMETINTYNSLIEKINNIEKQNSSITSIRKIRYILCELYIDIIAIDVLTQFLFGRNICRIINDVYSYILGLF